MPAERYPQNAPGLNGPRRHTPLAPEPWPPPAQGNKTPHEQTATLTATLTFIGSVVSRITKLSLVAKLWETVSTAGTTGSFFGSNFFARQFFGGESLTGSTTSFGVLQRNTTHALAGKVKFVGSFLFKQAFTATLKFIGSIASNTRHALQAFLLSTTTPPTPIVVHATQNTATSEKVTIPAATAGNLLVALINDAGLSEPQGKDNISGETGWTTQATHGLYKLSTFTFWVATKIAVGGETEIKTNLGGTVRGICCFELSNVAREFDVIVHKDNAGVVATVTSPEVTTTNANDILLGLASHSEGKTPTAWTGTGPMTNVATESTSAQGGYYIPGTTLSGATFTANWTGTVNSGLLVVALLPAPSGFVKLGRNIFHALTATLTLGGVVHFGTIIEKLTATLKFAGQLPRTTLHALRATLTSGTFGQTSIGTGEFLIGEDGKRVSKFVSPAETVEVKRLSVYLESFHSGASQKIKGVIYADSSGKPGSLLGTSEEVIFHLADPTGWYDFKFATPISLTSGSYWLGTISGASGGTAQTRFVPGVNSIDRNSNTYASGPSNPFGTPEVEEEGELSVYATYGGTLLQRNIFKQLAAKLPFSGLLTKVFNIAKSVTGTLTFAGLLNRSTSHALKATLTFAGALAHNIVRALTATLKFAGVLGSNIAHALTATLKFAGALGRNTAHALTATLPFSGTLLKVFNLVKTLAGTLPFAGVLNRAISHTLQATLTFAGALGRVISRALTATLTFAGTLGHNVSHALAATLKFAGVLLHSSTMILKATLTFAGTLLHNVSRALSATLTFTGALVRSTSHALAGTLKFAGVLAKQATHAVTATLTFAGTIGRKITHGLQATLSFLGHVAQEGSFVKALAATLQSVGKLSTGITHALTATLTFAGSVARTLTHILQGTLKATAAFPRNIVHRLTGTLPLVGVISRNIYYVLRATLLSTATLARLIKVVMKASLALLGSLRRSIAQTLRATLQLAGRLVPVQERIVLILKSALSFIGRLILPQPTPVPTQPDQIVLPPRPLPTLTTTLITSPQKRYKYVAKLEDNAQMEFNSIVAERAHSDD